MKTKKLRKRGEGLFIMDCAIAVKVKKLNLLRKEVFNNLGAKDFFAPFFRIIGAL